MPSLTSSFTGVGTSPSISSVSVNGNYLRVVFSESMSSTGLTTIGNYSIPGLTVSRAEVEPKSNNTTVVLTLTGFLANTPYTLTVSNVTDAAGNLVA